MLQSKVTTFDVRDADYYSDEYDTDEVSFYIPYLYVLATYDKDGTILRTAERSKDAALPRPVIESVARTYPNWTFAKDVYKVSFYDSGMLGKITKMYKIVLKNGDKRIKVKTDEEGNFL